MKMIGVWKRKSTFPLTEVSTINIFNAESFFFCTLRGPSLVTRASGEQSNPAVQSGEENVTSPSRLVASPLDLRSRLCHPRLCSNVSLLAGISGEFGRAWFVFWLGVLETKYPCMAGPKEPTTPPKRTKKVTTKYLSKFSQNLRDILFPAKVICT